MDIFDLIYYDCCLLDHHLVQVLSEKTMETIKKMRGRKHATFGETRKSRKLTARNACRQFLVIIFKATIQQICACERIAQI